MRIAIVDDIASEREILKAGITEQTARLSLDAVISCHASGTDFLAEARTEHFDLVFLDIYMEKENGVDTAEELRRFDRDCEIVFPTTSPDHALDGYRVRALHYLVKPCDGAAFAALFDEVIKRHPEMDRFLEVDTTGCILRLHLRDILYAEHFKHQIHIYLTGGEEAVTRRTFREFTAPLTDGRFFLCSRGVLVNMEHAADFDGTDFILKNGKRVPVSRSLAETARTAFGGYLFRNYGRRG